jgi:ABC-2 type transport system ATP-binding protein
MEWAIETRGLVKRYGRQTAVDGVELRVPIGSVYGFLGQNGAGKTTTIRLLLGLLHPDAGEARLFGLDVARRRREAVARVGSLVETPALYDRLTGRENLAMTARLIRAGRGEVDRVLEIADLTAAADRLVAGYSLGMRQRLAVARALLGRPRLLILDEPGNGLDPDGIREMRELIRVLPARDGVTVFVSSHLLAEVEQIATHVGLMHRGRLLTQSTLEALKRSRSRRLDLRVGDVAAARRLLASQGLEAEEAGQGLSVRMDGARLDAAAVNRGLVEGGVEVFHLAAAEPSLEAIYLDMVGSGRPQPELRP